MTEVILWLVAIETIGLITFPICFFLFRKLKDRGYGISKPLGLLVLAYISWITSSAQLVPSTQLTIGVFIVILALIGGWLAWKQRAGLVSFIRKERYSLIAIETVFLVTFASWAIYRAYDPAIANTEQPMDFGFLNAAIRNYIGEPKDPWLWGESISYYYFGYWIMAMLSKATGIQGAISYNLSLALIPAMAATGMFALVLNLVRMKTKYLKHAFGAGLVATILLVVAANLEGFLEFMRANGMGSRDFWHWLAIEGITDPIPSLTDSWRPQEFMWWWRATRVISTFEDGALADYTIHEFPFFSFLLGDLHPHVMSIPFVIMFLTMSWNYLQSPQTTWSLVKIYRNPDKTSITSTSITISPMDNLGHYTANLVAISLSLGGLAFINMWDLPIFAMFLIGVAGIKAYSTQRDGSIALIKEMGSFAIPVIILALILIAPYLVSFTSQVSGISAVGEHATRLPHFLIVWSLFIILISPFIVSVFWKTTIDQDWPLTVFISLLVGFLPLVVWVAMSHGVDVNISKRLFGVFPFAILITAATYSAIWLSKQGEKNQGTTFALMLAALGLLLVMGPELLYVDDGFGGAWERMNTVFKLYFQAWIVLSVTAGYGIFYWYTLRSRDQGRVRLFKRLWLTVIVILFTVSAYYPVAASATKGNLFSKAPTLNGLAYLVEFNQEDEYNAIEFVRKDAGLDSTVLEAFGNDYTPFGRISSSSGVPTVLGWAGHQLQWRGTSSIFQGREGDIATIYQTEDVQEAINLLDKYHIDYVYVGNRERDTYGTSGLEKFAEFMDIPFQEGSVIIYRRRK